MRVTQVERIRARQRDFWERSLGLGRFQLFHPSGFQVCHCVSRCVTVCQNAFLAIFGCWIRFPIKPGQGWAANEAAQQYDEMKVARKAGLRGWAWLVSTIVTRYNFDVASLNQIQ